MTSGLPGDGGRNWTVAKEDAARVNAASGGRRPAARDGGDTSPAGIAAELRAAGPAHFVGVHYGRRS